MKNKIEELKAELEDSEPDKIMLQFLVGDLQNLYEGEDAEALKLLADMMTETEKEDNEELKDNFEYYIKELEGRLEYLKIIVPEAEDK